MLNDAGKHYGAMHKLDLWLICIIVCPPTIARSFSYRPIYYDLRIARKCK